MTSFVHAWGAGSSEYSGCKDQTHVDQRVGDKPHNLPRLCPDLISSFQVGQWSGMGHFPPRKEQMSVLCTSYHQERDTMLSRIFQILNTILITLEYCSNPLVSQKAVSFGWVL